MRRPDPEKLFQLEALEQRIMLSADPLLGAVAAWQIEREDPLLEDDPGSVPAEEILISSDSSDAASHISHQAYSQESLNILQGMEDLDLLSDPEVREESHIASSGDKGLSGETPSESPANVSTVETALLEKAFVARGDTAVIVKPDAGYPPSRQIMSNVDGFPIKARGPPAEPCCSSNTAFSRITAQQGQHTGHAYTTECHAARAPAEAVRNPLSSVPVSMDGSAVDLQDGAKWLTAAGELDGADHTLEFSVTAGDYMGLGLTVEGSETPWPVTGMNVAGELRAIAMGDFNGDTHPDLLATINNYDDDEGPVTGQLIVFTNNGDGAFTAGDPISIPAYVTHAAVGDVNGDGHLDLVATTLDEDDWPPVSNVVVLFGDGNGDFGDLIEIALPGNACGLAVGDLDGVQGDDIVVAYGVYEGEAGGAFFLRTYTADGQGGLSEPQDLPLSEEAPNALALGDLDGDGRLDAVVSNGNSNWWGTNTVSVLLGRGDGAFGTERTFNTGGFPLDIALADLNGNGTLDLITASGMDSDWNDTDSVSVLMGTGDGGFGPPAIYGLGGIAPDALAVGDVTGDGVPDIITTHGSSYELSLLHGDGTGGFEYRGGVETGPAPFDVVLGDLTGNGILDMVTADRGAQGNGGTQQATVSVLYSHPPVTLELLAPNSDFVTVGTDEGGLAMPQVIRGCVAGSTGVYSARVSGGEPGKGYKLTVTINADFELPPPTEQPFAPRDISANGKVVGHLDLMITQDAYSVAVEEGDSLVVTVTTLDHAPQEPANDLVPKLSVTDETGAVVAQDDDLEGHLALTAGSSGLYTFLVDAVSGTGDYVLHVKGAGGTFDQPFEVTGSNVAADTVLATFPDLFIVDFSKPVDLSSVSPSDLTLNGAPAQSVTVLGAARLGFEIAALNAGSGSYEAAVEAGAFSSIAGEPVAAFSLAFETDTTPPAVTNISLTEGEILSPGELAVTITFSKELATDDLDADHVELRRNIVDEGWMNPETFEYAYDPDNCESVLELTFSYLWEGPYTLTLLSGHDAFRDPAGNLLDGNGDGVGGDSFVLSFNVDHPDDRVVPTPFWMRPPAGGRVYHSSWSTDTRGVFHGPGDVDTFIVPLAGGQAATVRLELEGSGEEEAELELLGPDNASLGTAPATTDAGGFLRMIPLPSTGAYSIQVTGMSGAAQYIVHIQLNADIEIEPNDSPAQAQVLSPGPSGGFYAVTGSAQPGNPDYYAFDLNEGDAAGLTVAVHVAGRPVDLTLLDATGTVQAIGVQGAATNADEFIRSFVAPETGTYYACLTGESESFGVGYTLVMTIDHELALYPNETIGEAQQLQTGQGAVGFINDPGYSLYPGDYESGADIRTVVPGVTLMVLDGDGNEQPDMKVRAGAGFRHDGGSEWRSRDQTLRTEFDILVDSVSIDIICSGRRYGGFLNAYNADGERIQSISTDQWANGPQTLTVSRPFPDIAYIEASGLHSYYVGLDNLVVGSNHADVYLMQFAAGEAVTIETTTPGHGQAGVPLHDLDPRLALYDSDGTLVAEDDDGASDGLNALLSFTAGTGPYFVEVGGIGRGDYQFHIQGKLMGADPVLKTTSPGVDAVLMHAPAVIDITFSEPLRADQLDPADLTVSMSGTDPGTATAVELVDAFTVRYTVGLDAADLEGLYSLTLAAGAVMDLQGTPSSRYSGEFFVDRTGPWVTTPSPLPAVGEPFDRITVEFSEPLLPSSATRADVSVIGPNGEISVSRLEVDGNTLSIVFSSPQDREGTYTFHIGPDITDLVGNPMDQNRNMVYGEEEDVYTGEFELVLPDLVVDTVTLNPASAAVGQTVDVTWLARNDSSMETPGDWSVYFWLSNDTTLDIDSDRLLYGMVAGAPVPMGQDATHGDTTTVAIPGDPSILEDTWYILVQVNALEDFIERSNENNTLALQIDLTAPDLTVEWVDVPVEAVMGETIEVTWRVTNEGNSDVVVPWNDLVILSDDGVISWDTRIPTRIHNIDTTADIPLGPGEYNDQTIPLTLPLMAHTPPGAYYLVVSVDRANAVAEADEDNNTAEVEMNLVLPPLPDLAVTAVEAPPEAWSGTAVTIEWEVTNEGDFAAAGTWLDRIYLADNPAGDNLIACKEMPYVAGLDPGESIVRRDVIFLPNEFQGTWWVVVKTDSRNAVFEHAALTNNTAVAEQPMTVNLSQFPNLVVSDVSAPANAFAGQTIGVEWTVTNEGSASTSVPYWVDSIRLTDDLGSMGSMIEEVSNGSHLAPGESYRTSRTITLPQENKGLFYIRIKTDAGDHVVEFDHEHDNVGVSGPMDVAMPPVPDLQVTRVIAPATAFSGQQVTVTWTVSNAGEVAVSEPKWYDTVYLSQDEFVGIGDYILKRRVYHNGPLAPGEASEVTHTVTLPLYVEGWWYFIVETDAGEQVFEHIYEGNNNGVTVGPTEIFLTPPPDLEVEAIDAPDNALASHPMQFTYRVANNGSLPTDVDKWVDEFYVSLDEAFDPETAIALEAFQYVGALEVGESYEKTITAILPDGISGDYYLFVRTDLNDDAYELDTDNNLRRSSDPIAITSMPADLMVESASAPAEAEAGDMIHVTWTVTNIGVGDTAIPFWTDEVVLHGPDGSRRLGTFMHLGLLDVEESYTRTALVTVPPLLATGEYSITVETNVSVSKETRVYEAGEKDNNRSTALPIAVVANPADLQIFGDIEAPAVAGSGETIRVSWTVVNSAPGYTQAAGWSDRVYLSEGTGLDLENDILLGSVKRSDPLDAWKRYEATGDFTIPIDLAGEYHVIVWTDAGEVNQDGTIGKVPETDETNNTAVAPSPLLVLLSPVPDLLVDEVKAPARAVTGQAIDITWTVKNDGADIDGGWRDKLYLSRDLVLDPSDAFLGEVDHKGGLGAGESYEKTATVYVPDGYSGYLFVFVVTNDGNRVYERDATENNVNFDPAPMDTILALPVDFVVTDIIVPAGGMPGMEATVEYTVRNDHPENTVEALWHDSLYLSADEQWDIDDLLIESVAEYRTLGPGESYIRTVVADLPAAGPGEYYVIVRTDIRNAVHETDTSNNALTSRETMSLEGQELILGTPHEGSLTAGQSAYFYVDVPPGETLYLVLDSASDTASNELYLRYEDAATRSRHDMSGPAPFSPDQRIAVEETGAGRYYILVYGVDETNDYTLEARLLGFEITDEGYGRGGTAGNFTFAINGARFDRSVTAALTDGSGFRLPAVSYHYVSTIRLYATFDLTRLEPGVYDLVLASRTLGEETRLEDALDVVSVTEDQSLVWVYSPPSVIVGHSYHFHASWANYSLNDLPAPLFVLHSERLIPGGGVGETFFSPNPRGPHHRTSVIFYGAGSGDGPPGILQPGQTESTTMYAKASQVFTMSMYYVTDLIKDPGLPFDWTAVHEDLRENEILSDINISAFDNAFDWMQNQVGETWGEYHAMLSRNATLIPGETGRSRTIGNLHLVEFTKALAATTTGISGRGFDYDMAVDLSGRQITAQNMDTGEIFLTESLSDGSFFLHGLSAGTYELSFDGAVVEAGGTVAVTEGEAVDGVVLDLNRGSRIGGVAFDSVSGTPVAGATVVLRCGAGDVRWTETDESGAYRFGTLHAGVYSLTFDLPGFAPTTIEQIVLGEQDDRIENVLLSLTARIQGFVQLQSPVPEDHDLIINAVRTGGGAHLVSIDGVNFSLTDIRGGTYSLTFFRFGYSIKRLDGLQVNEGEVLDLGAVDLVRAARVEGSINNQISGLEIDFEETVVAAMEGDEIVAAAIADSSGHYALDGLPPGTYDVRIVTPGIGLSTEQQVTVQAGSTVDSVDLALLPGGVITGTVTNKANRQPAAGVTVQLIGSDGSSGWATTDENGVYRFEWLGADSYVVGLTTGGVDGSGSVSVVDLDGTEIEIDLAYHPVATLGGKLLSASGLPVSGGVVKLYHDDAAVATAQVDGSGAFEFALFQEGKFSLHAGSENFVFLPIDDISIDAGENIIVEMIAGSGTLAVTVEHPTGAAGGNCLVRIEPLSGGDGVALNGDLDQGETLQFSGIPSGEYRVQLWTLDGYGGAVDRIAIAEGETAAVTVELVRQRMVSGAVADVHGDPLAGAWVILASTADPNKRFFSISEASGHYEITHIEPGEYEMVVMLDGYAAIILPPVVIADDTALDDVLLVESTTEITGRTITPDGTPLAGAIITILDGDGREIGYAVAGPDGSFTVTTASGEGLVCRIIAEGFLQLEQSGLTVEGGAILDLDDQELAAVALPQAAAVAAGFLGVEGVPKTEGLFLDAGENVYDVYGEIEDTVLRRMLARQPQNFDPGSPSFLDLILEIIKGVEKESDHVELGDIEPCPPECKAKCESSRAAAVSAWARQDMKWELVEQWQDVCEQYVRHAILLFLAEVATTAATISSAIIAGYGVAAYAGSSAAFGAMQLAGVKVLTKVAKVGGLLAQGINWITSSSTASGAPQSAGILQQVESTVGTGNTVANNINDIIDLVNIATLKNDFLQNFPLFTLIGLLTGWRSIVAYATVQNTIETLQSCDSSKLSLEKAVENYKAAVEEANTALDTYNECTRNCQTDDNDDDNDYWPPTDGSPTSNDSPYDPNDILGPEGVGEERWVPGDATLDYMIRFENDAELATAPARMVRITQQLDDDLDFRTFRVGNMGFGDIMVEVPANTPFFMTRLDLVEEMGFYLDIAAGINVLTGEATWVFTTIDPGTGALSSDPMLGFLPPNLESPEGQGWVTYTIKPGADVRTGTVIDAEARIIFDTEDPIDTPPIFNTVDAVAPVSRVADLPEQSDEEQIMVSWTGQDDENGSSIAFYTIYVSESGGPFLPWLVKTTATRAPFVGKAGRTYTFYCVAEDAAGNREQATFAGHATILIGQDLDPPTVSLVVPAVGEHISVFEIDLNDVGTGIDDGTVEAGVVSLAFNGEPLTKGVDYSFYYNSLNDLITLSPLGVPVFAEGLYTLTLEDGIIRDNAGNPLTGTAYPVISTLTILGGETIHTEAPYELDLHSYVPGHEGIANWTVDWGDGKEPVVYPGDHLSVEYAYESPSFFSRDLDKDGDVDGLDALEFVRKYRNGEMDHTDLALFAAQFGRIGYGVFEVTAMAGDETGPYTSNKLTVQVLPDPDTSTDPAPDNAGREPMSMQPASPVDYGILFDFAPEKRSILTFASLDMAQNTWWGLKRAESTLIARNPWDSTPGRSLTSLFGEHHDQDNVYNVSWPMKADQEVSVDIYHYGPLRTG